MMRELSMPRPKVHPGILQKLKELWADDPGRSGLTIHEMLKKEPITAPSLRWVQLRVAELNRDSIKLEPQVELLLWEHEWFQDPEKAPILLAMHYTLLNIEGPDSPRLTVEEAKWGLKIGAFFDLSSPIQAYLLLRFAGRYAHLERTAHMLRQVLDTREIDLALLGTTGMFGGNLSEIYQTPVGDFIRDLQRLAPHLLETPETEESVDEIPPVQKVTQGAEAVQDIPVGVSQGMLDLWKQLDMELALNERQGFIAEARTKSEGEENWDGSKEKILYDAREQAIQGMANHLHATPEGEAAYVQFLREAMLTPKIRIP